MLRFLILLFCFPAFVVMAQRNKETPPGSKQVKALSRAQATKLTEALMEQSLSTLRPGLKAEWDKKEMVYGGHKLRFQYHLFGSAPEGGRSLYISMHGGGNAPVELNDQQWKNQIKLYRPAEGIYLAPRAPTNTWNLWHEPHIDSLFDKLIRAAVLYAGVDPNKVYLMGYSAGGDGVYQLAPRMADRWAAAAMMAGHPNETSPLGLRNIGFALHMGALDSAYNRNDIARRWGHMLDSLSKADPGGYRHQVQIHEGRGHWMNRQDSVALPWMASFERNPLPEKVVWKQDDVHHTRFYWLAVPAVSIKTGGEIIARYRANEVDVDKNYSDTLILRFNDKMLNLNRPVTIRYLGAPIHHGKIKRKAAVISQTIEERKDPDLVFSAEVILVKGSVIQE